MVESLRFTGMNQMAVHHHIRKHQRGHQEFCYQPGNDHPSPADSLENIIPCHRDLTFQHGFQALQMVAILFLQDVGHHWHQGLF